MPSIGKLEDVFKVTDSWTASPTQLEIEKIIEDHEIKVVGPPLKVE